MNMANKHGKTSEYKIIKARESEIIKKKKCTHLN